jgi:hypothetical protein
MRLSCFLLAHAGLLGALSGIDGGNRGSFSPLDIQIALRGFHQEVISLFGYNQTRI